MVLGVGVGITAFAVYAGYYKTQVDNLADDLVSGKITVDEWEAGMETELQKLHTTAYIIGIGGIALASAEAFATIATIVETQSEFLRKWAAELRKEATHSAAKIKARAAMYLNAANATLLIALTDSLGLPRLPAYPGERSHCLVNCRCSWNIQRVAGGWNCTWVVNHDGETCPECVARGNTWNPLRIRSGVIQNAGGIGLYFDR